MPVIEASHNAMKTIGFDYILHAQKGVDDCHGSISSVCLCIFKNEHE